MATPAVFAPRKTKPALPPLKGFEMFERGKDREENGKGGENRTASGFFIHYVVSPPQAVSSLHRWELNRNSVRPSWCDFPLAIDRDVESAAQHSAEFASLRQLQVVAAVTSDRFNKEVSARPKRSREVFEERRVQKVNIKNAAWEPVREIVN